MATADFIEDAGLAKSKAQSRAQSAPIPYLILKALGSLKITVVMFVLALLIVLFGTLAQDELTLAEVKREYFNCWVAMIHFDLLLPTTLVPHGEPLWGGMGFYMPGGASIGFVLLVNLIAAKVTRFKMFAKGSQLVGGIVVSLIGAGLIAAVIMSGHAANGLQGEPLIAYDTLWNCLKGGMVVITMAMFGYAIAGKIPKLVRILLIALAVISFGVTVTILRGGEQVRLDDSGLRIVWQLLQASVASCVALAGLWMLFGKRGGNVLIHAGVGLLMVGQFVFGDRQVEQRMALAEGRKTNLAIIEDEIEIALIDVSNPEEDVVHAIPESTIRRVSRSGGIIEDPSLPCRVRILDYMQHSQLRPLAPDDENLATTGLGTREIAIRQKPFGAAVTEKRNIAAAYVELLAKEGEESYGVYLLTQDKNDLSQMYIGMIPDELEPAEFDGKSFLLAIRYKQVRKPYDVFLKDVERTDYSGTETPRDYSSRIVITPRSSEGSMESRTSMNNPIRFKGETFYQSRYNKIPISENQFIETTGLQVVRNAGWVIPYICCMMVFWGMFAHFGTTLVRFSSRVGREAIANMDKPKASFTRGIVVASVAVGFCMLICAAFARPEKYAEDQVDWAAIKSLPVQHEGRIKSLDSVARNILQYMSEPLFATAPSVKDNTTGFALAARDGGVIPKVTEFHSKLAKDSRKYQPSEWLLGVMAREAWTRDVQIFRVYHPDLRGFLDLEKRKGYRYSYNEIVAKRPEFIAELAKFKGKERDAMTLREQKFAALQGKLNTFDLLEISYRPPELPAVEEGSSRRAIQMELAREAGLVARLEGGGPPGMIPPLDDATKENLVSARWQAYRGAIVNAIIGVIEEGKGEEDLEIASQFAAIIDGVRAADVKRLNSAVTQYRAALEGAPLAAGFLQRAEVESWLNKFNPTAQGVLLYILASVLSFAGFLTGSENLRRGAFWMVVAVLVIHTVAIISRMYITGRAPVINLYSSAVFIGWACVFLCIILERIFPIGIANLVASVTGAFTLSVARFLDTSDTMPVLQAVLDTQFWLSTHVVTITAGYAVTFAAGFLGICALVHRVVHRVDAYPASEVPTEVAAKQSSMYRMIYGVVCFAIFFSFIGTVLGGLWADDSWGRFWGWDPKENGAMMIVIWNALILHARWDKQVGQRGFAALAVIGNVMTAWSWFGTNQLGIGLHSYGFTSGTLIGLGGFMGANLLFVVVALIVTGWLARSRDESKTPLDEGKVQTV